MGRSTALLSDAIDQYLGYLRAKRMADNTVKGTTYLLKGTLACWGNIQVCNLQPRHIDRLFAEKGWSPRTHNTNLQIIKAFLAWCRNAGYLPINSDPTFGWRNQRVPDLDSLRVPIEEFGALLDACEHPRDRAQVAVGLFLFLRGSELINLRIGDVDFKRYEVHVYRVKTKQEDTLPMCTELAEELRPWLNWYRQDRGILRDDWYLLPSKAKQPFTRVNGKLVRPEGLAPLQPDKRQSHPYRPAQRALEALGYDTLREGEHTLRRSGARAYADSLRAQGYDGALLRVASMLGHKDTKQTERYIGWGLERRQRNEALAGKSMFGDTLAQASGTILPFVREESDGGSRVAEL